MLIIDSHEPNIVFEAFQEADVSFEKKEIRIDGEQVGDILGDKFIIERKTEDDFWSSMVDGRLYDTFQKMVTYFPTYWKIVIVEGYLTNIMMKHPKNKGWVRSMRWVAMQYDVLLIQVDSTYELVKEVQAIMKKAGKEPKIRLRKQMVPKGIPDCLKIIASFPNISIKRGTICLKTTGTLRNFVLDLLLGDREILLAKLKENGAKVGEGILDKITMAFEKKYE